MSQRKTCFRHRATIPFTLWYPFIAGWFISGKILLKWIISGYPHFRKPSYLWWTKTWTWFQVALISARKSDLEPRYGCHTRPKMRVSTCSSEMTTGHRMVGWTHMTDLWPTSGGIPACTGWWFGTWLLWLSIYWESYSQLTKIFQRGRYTTNQCFVLSFGYWFVAFFPALRYVGLLPYSTLGARFGKWTMLVPDFWSRMRLDVGTVTSKGVPPPRGVQHTSGNDHD